MTTNTSSRTTTACSILLALLLAIVGAATNLAAQERGQIKESAAQQMTALIEEKRSRSVAQRKMDSSLVFATRASQGEDLRLYGPIAAPGPALLEADGRILVDVKASISASLIEAVELLGAQVVNAHPALSAMRLLAPIEGLEAIAARTDVLRVRQADPMMLQVTSEGDVAHGADVVRTDLGIDGTGVMVCAISDSVESLADLQGAAELPAVTVLPGQAGTGTSEGTALLEIVHDLAPGATLAFATGQGGLAQMAQNILDLEAAGCDVIVDDILYFAEGVFQDDIITQAVDTVTALGVLYVTSAGNSGNLNDGTAGVFEGDFLAGTAPGPLLGAVESVHDYGAGQVGNEVTLDSPFLFTLQWTEPLGGSVSDYDLFLLDAALANVIAFSTNTQDGDDDPLEFIFSDTRDDTGNQLVVAKFAGDDEFFHLNVHRGRLGNATDGQIFGHPGSANALTVGAINVTEAGGGQFFGGAGVQVESFSSDGPRRIFFNPDGSPIGGARSGPPVPEVRQKPDVVAADGVSTATPGFNPFFGSSASSPHSAAIAALLTELFPSLSVTSRLEILRSSALDIEDPGFDRDSGSGIINLTEAVDQPIFADGFESGDTSAWSN